MKKQPLNFSEAFLIMLIFLQLSKLGYGASMKWYEPFLVYFGFALFDLLQNLLQPSLIQWVIKTYFAIRVKLAKLKIVKQVKKDAKGL
jgi:hypothetical protein